MIATLRDLFDFEFALALIVRFFIFDSFYALFIFGFLLLKSRNRSEANSKLW